MSFGTIAAVAAGTIVAGSVASSIIGADAARKASKAQQQGASLAITNEQKAFKDYQTRADTATRQSTDLFNQARDQSLAAQQGALGTSSNALLSARDQNNAAQLGTRDQNNALQREVYDRNIGLQQPYYQTGVAANNKMSDYLGLSGNTGNADYGRFTRGFTMDDFQQDPGYGFRFQEGLKALERSAAAKGGLLGGAQMKANQRFGSDYASNEFQNAFNRFDQNRNFTANQLTGAINTGTNAANQMGSYGTNYGMMTNANNTNYANALSSNNQNYATGIGNLQTNYGNNISSIYQNGANNQSNMLNTYAQNYGAQKAQNSANISNMILAGANARASGYTGTANAYNAGIGNITSAAGQALGFSMNKLS